ncbi:MAG: complex I subunit 5 family protein [Desulfurococcaceae archaeon]
MEFLWRALPVVIILVGHTPRLQSSRAGLLSRVIGYIALSLNTTLSDPFVDMLLLLVIGTGIIATVYTTHYSRIKYGDYTLVLAVDSFAVSMALVFTSRSLIEMITFWLITELIGFFLVAYDFVKARNDLALAAATKYLLFSMIPTDVSLFVILALTGFTEAFEVELKSISLVLQHPVILSIVILGFFSKAAIFPLHFWLPDAHSVAPSPASALLSGLMVKMGVYALYLLSHYLLNMDIAVSLMLVTCGFTVIYGALQAIVQLDIKRILAYSTTSNTALIVLLIALHIYSKDTVFLEAALLYTLVHGVYKATLFLDSGLIEILTHERSVKNLGYISRITPFETAVVLLAILIMFGFPPSIGFLAKVFLFSSVSKYLEKSWIYLFALVIASLKVFLSIIYNVVYLKAHLAGELIENKKIDKHALVLQPYIFSLALMGFILTFILLSLSYPGYIEFYLLRKTIPAIIASLVLLVFTIFFIMSLLKKGTPHGER